MFVAKVLQRKDNEAYGKGGRFVQKTSTGFDEDLAV